MQKSALVISQAFFSRPVLDVAPDLLGKFLVTEEYEGMITEVEAYDGPEDKACHGRFGPTDRTRVMFGPAGHWYVYLCYGMHWMLNVVTGDEGYPAAVLLRGVGGRGLGVGEDLSGPGKLTKAFGIDGSCNGKIADESSGLWIEDHGVVVDQYDALPRIGIEYAEEWKEKPYRFLMV